jgi:hypothetical protein
MSAVSPNHDAVLVHIPPSNASMRGPLEFDHLMDIEEAVIEAVDAAGTGVHDGHDIGQGEFTLFSYGPDADALWDTIRPVLVRFPKCLGARVEKRHHDIDVDGPSESFVLEGP